jgi:hypothetical protein
MRLTKSQLQLLVNILNNKPKEIPVSLREVVSQLHDDKLIAFTHGRYVVTGRGQCALTIIGYKGPFTGVEIQPPRRPVAGRVRGTTAAERRLSKTN